MSIYDHRDRSAYGNPRYLAEPHYCKNKHILKWWTSSHDEVLSKQIEKEQWVWYWGVTDEIVALTPTDTIEAWRAEDPLCSKYAWYNILMYFAASRADKLGLTKAIRKPQWKTCPLCDKRFIEDSLPYPLVKRLGANQLDFCSPCLRDTVLQGSGDATLSRQEVLAYLQELTDVSQCVPPQSFEERMDALHDLSTEERLVLLQVLRRKPTLRRVKELFGSWLKALIEAGILEDGTRRTSRGTQCLAKDGHVCLSLGEKTIDDFLHACGIPHEKEPRYPEGNFRADFAVDDVLIEYFGLKGDPDYDEKTRLKQRICKKHNIKLISIYPSDLVSSKKLEGKLSRGLSL
jgi:hypothetical protein